MRKHWLRLFRLLQIVAVVALASSLAAPSLVEAAQRQANKKARPAAQSVERKKTPLAKQVAASKGRKEVKASVAAKARKTSDPSERIAKGHRKSSKGDVVLAKQLRSSKKDEKLAKAGSSRHRPTREVLARGKQSKHHMRLVALRHAKPVVRVASVQPRLTVGEQLGLREANDELELNSSVALVVDQTTNEVLFSKNDAAVLPIASLTKLMTGLVVMDEKLPLEEVVEITAEDIDTVKGSRSRLSVGTLLTRRELLHLALMSSENRAANALGRSHPGGMVQFVRLMNAKARELGMNDTFYVEPTGLSSRNQSSARDLATLVSVAYQRPILRSMSTSPSHMLDLGHRTLEFRNSNGLIRNPDWEIGLQKTGYISEAGRCLVMQARVAGRQLIMVFLDATGKVGRAQDAERVKRWVEAYRFPPVNTARPQG